MNLITAKCPDCGADLKIPEDSSTVTCEYCGSQVIVTDILGTSSVMQNCMTLAFAALEKNDYEDACGHFNSALEIDMKNYSAWFGKAVCTGRTGKLIDLRIDEMINLFETAFKYAPADKLANSRRNASAEIIKAIKGLMDVFKMQQEMLSFEEDDEDMKKGLEDASNKVKKEFFDALDKAREYDPSNADIDPLKNEIIQAQAAEKPPPTMQVNVQQPGNIPPPVNEKKKSGCAFMLAMTMFFIFACFGIFKFLL